jgi:hypothetical protein
VSVSASVASPAHRSANGAQPENAVHLIFGTLILATMLAAVPGSDTFVLLSSPLLCIALLVLASIAPLRWTLCVAMFLSLATDRPGDSEGRWASPFIAVGGVMFQNLNKFISIEALKFSGVFLLVGYLLLVRSVRVLNGRARDTAGSLKPAAPIVWCLVLGVVAAFGSVAFGMLRGGDIQMAKIQIQTYLQLLGVAYLFSVSLRGERDYRVLATVIVAAAAVKALMAVWIRSTLPPLVSDEWGIAREMEYATNHGDSLLFACASAILLGPLFHQPNRRQIWSFLFFGAVIVAGIVANDRRIAWVQTAFALGVLLFMNPTSVFSRRTLRFVTVASPVLLLYLVLGWSSASRVFTPVQFVRNLVLAERIDGSIDRSTLFRDVENFNLVYTFQGNPLLGTGFGHPFQELVRGDDISVFKEYAFLPHNSLLGLWTFTGGAGVTGLLAIFVVTLFFAIRSHSRARSPNQAIAATASIGCLVAYLVHMWADIGFSEAPTIFLMGLAIAVTSQLALTTGAWPSRWRHSRTSLAAA